MDPNQIIHPVYKDNRGFFQEMYNKKRDDFNCVQINHSYSEKMYTIRGMHYQTPPYEQSKVIKVVKGSIYDVVININPYSLNFKKVETFLLTDGGCNQVVVPRGYAHGFITLDKDCHVIYMVDNYYSKENSCGFKWHDPFFNVKWPVPEHVEPIVSTQDSRWPDITSHKDFEWEDF